MADKIDELVCTAIDEFNKEVSEPKRLSKGSSTTLYGAGAVLDSLDLVNLIVLVEEKVRMELNRSISLADERALSQKNSPFRSVATLCEYVRLLVAESAP